MGERTTYQAVGRKNRWVQVTNLATSEKGRIYTRHVANDADRGPSLPVSKRRENPDYRDYNSSWSNNGGFATCLKTHFFGCLCFQACYSASMRSHASNST